MFALEKRITNILFSVLLIRTTCSCLDTTYTPAITKTAETREPKTTPYATITAEVKGTKAMSEARESKTTTGATFTTTNITGTTETNGDTETTEASTTHGVKTVSTESRTTKITKDTTEKAETTTTQSDTTIGPHSLPASDFFLADRQARPYYPKYLPGGGLSMHHIVPQSRLRTFYNSVLNRSVDKEINRLGRSLDVLLRGLKKKNKGRYGYYTGTSFIDGALNFSRALQEYTSAKGLDEGLKQAALYAATYFTWLPGNLFIGPRPETRTDDRGSEFDDASKYIVDHKQYLLLLDIDLTLKNFNDRPNETRFESFEAQMDKLDAAANYTVLYEFNTINWQCSVKRVNASNDSNSSSSSLKSKYGFFNYVLVLSCSLAISAAIMDVSV